MISREARDITGLCGPKGRPFRDALDESTARFVVFSHSLAKTGIASTSLNRFPPRPELSTPWP